MDSHFPDIFLQAVGAARAAERQWNPQQQPVDLRVPVNAPSDFDVISGRGQGVQRHPGNLKYRRLVFLNKGLYARCPKADKAKISKGIVAAVRELGGRFLELDERTGTYRDIGDKKAWSKTSQALREGQKMVRQKLDGNMASDDFDTLVGAVRTEGYFGYSLRALESLYKSHPPSNRLQDLSPARAMRAPLSLDAPIGNGVETVEGTGVDRSTILREVGGRQWEDAYCFDPPGELFAEAGDDVNIGGEALETEEVVEYYAV